MINIILTYYNEPHFLKWWHYKINQYNEHVPNSCMLTIVDDGSMEQPASNFFNNVSKAHCSLYRITEDIGFNSHGARNLAMRLTDTKWNFLSDIDRRYYDESMYDIFRKVKEDSLDPSIYYRFVPVNERWPTSINDFIVAKELFWKTGGYDEEFANCHWGDRLFFENLDQFAQPSLDQKWVIKYMRNARHVEYSDTFKTLYPDDNTLIHPNVWKNDRLRTGLVNYVSERNKYEHMRQRKPIIQYSWERIF